MTLTLNNLKIAGEALLTLWVLLRLFSFFHRQKTWGMLFLLAAYAALFSEKNFLLGLPHCRVVLPYFFAVLLTGIALLPGLSWLAKKRGKKSSPQDLFLNNGLAQLAKACEVLSQSKTGALFAIERHDDLSEWIEKGVAIDAKMRHELLLTIFTPPTYLHDGGVILCADRIASCSAIFPLSDNPKIKKDLGTRHRAALGMSEETDALCLVVSEETGKISIADQGSLFYAVPPEAMEEIVKRLLAFKKIKHPDYLEGSQSYEDPNLPH